MGCGGVGCQSGERDVVRTPKPVMKTLIMSFGGAIQVEMSDLYASAWTLIHRQRASMVQHSRGPLKYKGSCWGWV